MSYTTLTTNDIDALYVREQIDHATWCNALRELRGDSTSHLGAHAIRTCEQLHACAVRFNSDTANMKAEKAERDSAQVMSWTPRAINEVLGSGSRVNVKSFKVFTDGSGAPAVIECTGYSYAFDYLGEVKCNLIGSPAIGSHMASEGAHRRALAAYTMLVHELADAVSNWHALNAAMYTGAV